MQVECVVYWTAQDAYDLTADVDTVRWSSSAVGGFGSASLTFRGDKRSRLPLLATVRLVHEAVVVFEGRIEDRRLTISEDSIVTEVTAFGLQRLLTEATLRRIWSWRDIPWHTNLTSLSGKTIRPSIVNIQTGTFDSADLTRKGIRVAGTSGSPSFTTGDGLAAELQLPSGVMVERLIYTLTIAGALDGFIQYSADGSSWTNTNIASNQTDTSLATTSARFVRVGGYYPGAGGTVNVADQVDFEDMRFLQAITSEDVNGGFYGGTILRDLIALIPGLQPGRIEPGSDFTIDALERSSRAQARSVVEEVAGYYANRLWGVWEDARFDWVTIDDNPEWVIDIVKVRELRIEQSVESLPKTVYVLYDDAASDVQTEQSSSSTEQTNPYVKYGLTKDQLVSPGFALTSLSASALAAKLVTEGGKYPSISGRISLPADAQVWSPQSVGRVVGQIRGGEVVALAGLTKTDPLAVGRDGETIFLVSSVEVDSDTGTAVLELESSGKSMDALLARLASVTRSAESQPRQSQQAPPWWAPYSGRGKGWS